MDRYVYIPYTRIMCMNNIEHNMCTNLDMVTSLKPIKEVMWHATIIHIYKLCCYQQSHIEATCNDQWCPHNHVMLINCWQNNHMIHFNTDNTLILSESIWQIAISTKRRRVILTNNISCFWDPSFFVSLISRTARIATMPWKPALTD